jgi:uncharacterized protein YjbJ (UPF0337 family)
MTEIYRKLDRFFERIGTAIALTTPGHRAPKCGDSLGGELNMADLKKDGLENQGEGMADELKGKVLNAVGGLTGDTSEQIKGKAEELKGKAKRKIGEHQVDADIDTDV